MADVPPLDAVSLMQGLPDIGAILRTLAQDARVHVSSGAAGTTPFQLVLPDTLRHLSLASLLNVAVFERAMRQLQPYGPPTSETTDVVSKDVRFSNALLAGLATDSNTNGGMPIPDLLASVALLRQPVAGISNPPAPPPFVEGSTNPVGVPGVLTRTIRTAAPVAALTALDTSTLPVQVELRAAAIGGDGQPLQSAVWQTVDTLLGAMLAGKPRGTTRSLVNRWQLKRAGKRFSAQTTAGEIIVPLRGVSGAAFIVTPPVRFVELTKDLPSPEIGSLEVSVRLSVASDEGLAATSGWVDLPPLPLPVARIPVPTVAAFFTKIQFDMTKAVGEKAKSRALVMVPKSSPLGNGVELVQAAKELQATLAKLADALALAGSFPPSSTSVLSQLGTVLEIIKGLTTNADIVAFRREDEIPNTGDIKVAPFAGKGGGASNPDHFQDEISSVVLVGRPGRAIVCRNNPKHEQNSGGEFILTVADGLAVTIATLHRERPKTSPRGRMHILHTCDGIDWGSRNKKQWADQMNAIRFASLDTST